MEFKSFSFNTMPTRPNTVRSCAGKAGLVCLGLILSGMSAEPQIESSLLKSNLQVKTAIGAGVHSPSAQFSSSAKDSPLPITIQVNRHGDEMTVFTTVIDSVAAASMVLFTAILTYLGFLQWRVLKRNLAETQEAVTIARQSADAATRSAKVSEMALIGAQRPVIIVRAIVRAIGAANPRSIYVPMKLDITFENIGSLPAIIDKIMLKLHSRPYIPQESQIIRPDDVLKSGAVLGRDDVIDSGAKYTLSYDANVRVPLSKNSPRQTVKDQHVTLIGGMRYRDQLDIVRERGFTLMVIPGQDILVRAIGPEIDFDRIVIAPKLISDN